MVNQAKLRSLKTAPKYQYGFEVPRDYADTVRLDKKNKNTRWQDAIKLELKQLEEYNVFIDHGTFHITKVPPGYQIIMWSISSLQSNMMADTRHRWLPMAIEHRSHSTVCMLALYPYKA